GRRTGMQTYDTDSSNPSRSVSYEYDDSNLLKTVSTSSGSNPTHYTYNAANLVSDIQLGNGIQEHLEYDDDNRLILVSYKRDDQVLMEINYSQIDGVGNRKVVSETLAEPGGLYGKYYQQSNLTDLVHVQVDHSVDFSYVSGGTVTLPSDLT